MKLKRIAARVADALHKFAGLSMVDARGRGNGSGWLSLFGGPENFQTDVKVETDTALSFTTVYACVTQIASDIAKLGLRLTELQSTGIWTETTSASFSPVLRKPNPYQTRQQFVDSWMCSKLTHGNTYGLKARDERNVVRKVFVLDPTRVTPLVAPNGSVFYQLNSDNLSGLPNDLPAVPASEIIHDRMECLFHPLVGVSPIFACGLAAVQGLNIQKNSARFFKNMSRPSGILTAPGEISDETAERLKREWEQNYASDKIGKVAVLGDSLKYETMTISAVDAQLVDQLKLSAEQVCSAFHVPGFMVGVGQMPSYDNVQALFQLYYGQCLQKLIESFECLFDEGLALPSNYRTEFDLADLLRMDGKSLAEVEGTLVQRGIKAPNEARRSFNLAPKTGGDSPYLQQQNFSLEALAKRDAQEDPFKTSSSAAPAAPDAPADPQAAADAAAAKVAQLFDDRLAAVLTKAEAAIERANEAVAATQQQRDDDEKKRAELATVRKLADALISRAKQAADAA